MIEARMCSMMESIEFYRGLVIRFFKAELQSIFSCILPSNRPYVRYIHLAELKHCVLVEFDLYAVLKDRAANAILHLHGHAEVYGFCAEIFFYEKKEFVADFPESEELIYV